MADTRRSEHTRSNSPEGIQDTRDAQDTEDTEDTEDTDNDENRDTAGEGDRPRAADRNGRPRQPADGLHSPLDAVREAQDQLARLTGRPAEGVSSLARTEDGWALTIEVVELERVPDTMSLLASYEVSLDTRGNLTGYRRTRRYERGRADRK